MLYDRQACEKGFAMKLGSAVVLAAAACLVLASSALARHVHYRSHPHREAHLGVMPDVLLANPYGDVIVNGSTGFHRSDAGIMVPDSEPPSFVAVGRASRSGLRGASGVPGYDQH